MWRDVLSSVGIYVIVPVLSIMTQLWFFTASIKIGFQLTITFLILCCCEYSRGHWCVVDLLSGERKEKDGAS